ncbi:hypothetical protein HDV00_000947 [Rhizophlyctis rosea]|nr:hypothetical protein HDV00_000947 [Rhizophlyctis rosea]
MSSPSSPDLFPVRTVHFSPPSNANPHSTSSYNDDDALDFFDDPAPYQQQSVDRPKDVENSILNEDREVDRKRAMIVHMKEDVPKRRSVEFATYMDVKEDMPKRRSVEAATYTEPKPPPPPLNTSKSGMGDRSGSGGSLGMGRGRGRGGGMAGFRAVRPSSAPPGKKGRDSLDPSIIEIYTKAMESLSRKPHYPAPPSSRKSSTTTGHKDPEALQEELTQSKHRINALLQEKKELMTSVRYLEQQSERMDRKYQDLLIVNKMLHAKLDIIRARKSRELTSYPPPYMVESEFIHSSKDETEGGQDLKTVAKSYKKQIKELQAEIDGIKKSTRYTKLAECQIECRVYFQENIRLKRLLQQYDIGATPGGKHLDETSQQLLQYDQTIDELTNRLNEVEGENGELRNHLSKSLTSETESTHTITSLRDELTSVHEHYRTLDAAHKNTTVELDKMKEERDALRADVEKREGEVRALQERVESLEREVGEGRGRVEAFEKEVESEKASHNKTKGELQRVLKNLTDMEQTKEELNRNLTIQTGLTLHLEQGLKLQQKTHAENIATLQTSHANHIATLTATHETETTSLHSEIASLKQQVDDARGHEARIREEGERHWKERVEEAEKRVGEVEKEWKGRCAGLEGRVREGEEKLREEGRSFVRQIRDLNTELDTSQTHITRLETQRDLLSRECSGYQSSYARAMQQIADLQRQLAESTSSRPRPHTTTTSTSDPYRPLVSPPRTSLSLDSAPESRRSSLPFSRSTSASSLSQNKEEGGLERMDSSDSRYTDKMNKRISRAVLGGSLDAGDDAGVEEMIFVGGGSLDAVTGKRGEGGSGGVGGEKEGDVHMDIGSREDLESPSTPRAGTQNTTTDMRGSVGESMSGWGSQSTGIGRQMGSLGDMVTVKEVNRSMVDIAPGVGEVSRRASRVGSVRGNVDVIFSATTSNRFHTTSKFPAPVPVPVTFNVTHSITETFTVGTGTVGKSCFGAVNAATTTPVRIGAADAVSVSVTFNITWVHKVEEWVGWRCGGRWGHGVGEYSDE